MERSLSCPHLASDLLSLWFGAQGVWISVAAESSAASIAEVFCYKDEVWCHRVPRAFSECPHALRCVGEGCCKSLIRVVIHFVKLRCCYVEASSLLGCRWWCFEQILTWLILPVVICLSQRLSHACLSINGIQWNCEWLIKTVIVYLVTKLTWITVVILELIHAVMRDSRSAVFIRYQPISFAIVVTHSNLIGSHGLVPRQTIQVSAPSAFDGSVLDYHGFYG